MSLRSLPLLSIIAAAPAAAWADAPNVMTDFGPTHSIVSELMSGVGTPDVLLSPGDDPHNFSLRPSQARTLSQADVVIWVGNALTPWLTEPLENLAGDAEHVSLLDTEGWTLLKTREVDAHLGHDDHEEHGDHDDHADHDDHEEHGDHDDHAGHDDHEEHGDHDDHADHDDHEEHGDHDDHAGHDDHEEHGDHDDHADHDDHEEHGDHDDHADHDDHDEHDEHDDHADHDDHEEHGDHDDHAGHDDHEEHGDHDDHADHDDHEEHGDHDDYADHDDHDEHEEHAGHDHGEFDPHAWLDPSVVSIWAGVVADTLSAQDPENAEAYATNLISFQAELTAVNDEIAAVVAELKEGQIILPHDNFQYFEVGAGFSPAGFISNSEDADPGAGHLRELRELVEAGAVTCVLHESPSDMEWATVLIEGTDAKTALVDATDQAGVGYIKMMQNLATTLRDCAN